jgi:hypothetical protein
MGSVRHIRSEIESSSAAPLLALFDARPTGLLENLPRLTSLGSGGHFLLCSIFRSSRINSSASGALFPSAQTPRPRRISTEKAYSGSAYYLFSRAAHVFTIADMRLILTNDIVAVRFVLGFERSAATAALSKERNISV